ncbi:hypothetical protein E1B28_011968 [Marasmius oreades]|uniref:DUF6533 domain-containing protein n=1 Tax=Marasmius oreades TaxID=181124 RepID=A0A9P7UNF9_9AGAR|nr:uncharacterized protein E1B28_011968 [Marasmius oreades]KAG7087920.1 hypothetical protein E1B28_011968 [Marasmius oreades]
MPNISKLTEVVLQALPDELPLPSAVETAAGAQAVNRSAVAALAFLFYDICLTFDEEVELFWPRNWTWMKFNFFFVRYVPLFVQIPLLFVGTELTPQFHFTSHDCFIWQVYQAVASICIIMSCDFVLLSRIYALYFAKKHIQRLVYICYVLEISGMCVGLGLALPGVKFDERCTVLLVPPGLLIYAGASIAFQALLFALTLYQFLSGLRMGWGNVPIVKLLMRDGTWAFFLLFIELVAEASLYGLKNHAFAGVLYSWLLTVYSFCGYRILFNINHLTRTPDGSLVSGTSATISNSFQFTSQFQQSDVSNSFELRPLSPPRVQVVP